MFAAILIGLAILGAGVAGALIYWKNAKRFERLASKLESLPETVKSVLRTQGIEV